MTPVSYIKIISLSILGTLLIMGSIVAVLLYTYPSELASLVVQTAPTTVLNERIIQDPTVNEQIIDTITQSNPAVVSVVITKDVPIFERYVEELMPFGAFGGSVLIPRVRQSGSEAREVGGGSGFIITSDGQIVTNRHVVDDEDASYSIITNDGTSYAVEVVAKDPALDIAVIQITDELPTALPFLSFTQSEPRLGESVIAIGNALAEFRNSVSVGVISGLARTVVAEDRGGMRQELTGVIQTDAAINPGNSGGPLLNLQGEVVGVNVAASATAENIGFALPAHVVEEVVTTLAK